jgi:hypothetical protein
MKNHIIFIALFILVSSLACSQNTQNFRTPETVMGYFANNVKNGNFDNVFLTSPFNDDAIITRINPGELINYMGYIFFPPAGNLPIQYHSIIKTSLLGRYAQELKRFVFSLLLSEEYPDLVSLRPLSVNDEILNNYFSLLDISNLQTMEFIRMDIYRPDIQFGERGKYNAERQYLNIYGCDEKVEYTVLYKHGGNYYVGGVILLRYGQNWYIESLNGIYSNIGTGCLDKVSGVAEYLYKYEIN